LSPDIPKLQNTFRDIPESIFPSGAGHLHTLNSRLLKLLGGMTVILLVAAGSFALITHHAMHQLVRRTLDSNVAKVRAILDAEAQNLNRNVSDYAVWDEMVENIENPDSAWYAENVTDWYPKAFDVDVILALDPAGRIVYSYGGLHGYEPGKRVPDMELAHVSPQRINYQGLWKNDGDTYLLAGWGVFPSNQGAAGDEPQGTLIAGYKITSERMRRLEDLTHEDLALCEMTGEALPQIEYDSGDRTSGVTTADGYCVWRHISGAPGAFVRVTSAFPAVDKTRALSYLGVILIAVIWLAVSLLAFGAVRRWVVRPVAKMRIALRKMEAGESVNWTNLVHTGDELEALCLAFGDVSSELKKSVESMNTIVEGAADSVLILNGDGLILMANEKARELFVPNLSPEKAVRLKELICEPARSIAELAWVELRTDGRYFGKFAMTTRHEDAANLEMNSVVLSDGRIFASFRDVTERERLQKEVASAVAKSRKLEGIQQAAVTLQHEINNPLTAVLGNAELIRLRLERDRVAPAGEREFIRAAVGDISELSRRMRDVLAKLRSLYNPVVSLHPVDTDQGAEMINLKDSR
jgi:signal transduction histidine kinase